jgi:hypothetical protein
MTSIIGGRAITLSLLYSLEDSSTPSPPKAPNNPKPPRFLPESDQKNLIDQELQYPGDLLKRLQTLCRKRRE